MDFEWHLKKAMKNERKHGISFDEAVTVFSDPLAGTLSDEPHSEQEQRWITIGTSDRGRVLVVAHCKRGDKMRLITARKATPRERSKYEEE